MTITKEHIPRAVSKSPVILGHSHNSTWPSSMVWLGVLPAAAKFCTGRNCPETIGIIFPTSDSWSDFHSRKFFKNPRSSGNRNKHRSTKKEVVCQINIGSFCHFTRSSNNILFINLCVPKSGSPPFRPLYALSFISLRERFSPDLPPVDRQYIVYQSPFRYTFLNSKSCFQFVSLINSM